MTMANITKPMLAGKCESTARLTYPVLATPKLDGIRCLIINGKAVSRAFKPIPNDYIRQTIELSLNSYQLDGEIMIGGRTFNDLSGDVRRKDGRPTDFYYAVFDYVSAGLDESYQQRMAELKKLILPPFVHKILPVLCNDELELSLYERDQLALGYEGVMVRSPNSHYKCGRSTANEGGLLKIKRFEDAEAIIYSVEEMMHNDNVATRDAFGRTERSTNQENMRPAGVMGKLKVRWHGKEHIEFEIGTGYTAAQRALYWEKRGSLIGKLVKFKHQPIGADVKPRFPVFLGFRDAWDL